MQTSSTATPTTSALPQGFSFSSIGKPPSLLARLSDAPAVPTQRHTLSAISQEADEETSLLFPKEVRPRIRGPSDMGQASSSIPDRTPESDQTSPSVGLLNASQSTSISIFSSNQSQSHVPASQSGNASSATLSTFCRRPQTTSKVLTPQPVVGGQSPMDVDAPHTLATSLTPVTKSRDGSPALAPTDLIHRAADIVQERAAFDDLARLVLRYHDEHNEYLRRHEETVHAAQREKEQADHVHAIVMSISEHLQTVRVKQEKRWEQEQRTLTEAARHKDVQQPARQTLPNHTRADASSMSRKTNPVALGLRNSPASSTVTLGTAPSVATAPTMTSTSSLPPTTTIGVTTGTAYDPAPAKASLAQREETERRLQEEKRRAEVLRRAEEEKRKAEEEQRKAREEKLKTEAEVRQQEEETLRRQEEERRRQDDERRKQEEAKVKHEEERRQEEKKRKHEEEEKKRREEEDRLKQEEAQKRRAILSAKVQEEKRQYLAESAARIKAQRESAANASPAFGNAEGSGLAASAPVAAKPASPSTTSVIPSTALAANTVATQPAQEMTKSIPAPVVTINNGNLGTAELRQPALAKSPVKPAQLQITTSQPPSKSANPQSLPTPVPEAKSSRSSEQPRSPTTQVKHPLPSKPQVAPPAKPTSTASNTSVSQAQTWPQAQVKRQKSKANAQPTVQIKQEPGPDTIPPAPTTTASNATTVPTHQRTAPASKQTVVPHAPHPVTAEQAPGSQAIQQHQAAVRETPEFIIRDRERSGRVPPSTSPTAYSIPSAPPAVAAPVNHQAVVAQASSRITAQRAPQSLESPHSGLSGEMGRSVPPAHSGNEHVGLEHDAWVNTPIMGTLDNLAYPERSPSPRQAVRGEPAARGRGRGRVVRREVDHYSPPPQATIPRVRRSSSPEPVVAQSNKRARLSRSRPDLSNMPIDGQANRRQRVSSSYAHRPPSPPSPTPATYNPPPRISDYRDMARTPPMEDHPRMQQQRQSYPSSWYPAQANEYTYADQAGTGHDPLAYRMQESYSETRWGTEDYSYDEQHPALLSRLANPSTRNTQSGRNNAAGRGRGGKVPARNSRNSGGNKNTTAQPLSARLNPSSHNTLEARLSG
ncbi:hypothetical protein K474DRAFT_1694739 [Panus rudis PR-1116 ss-1]|nr:hypothetical protein K474DRAFT_1694739 [Panus rudis PR-1116 ss-1]